MQIEAAVVKCMADYDETGWRHSRYGDSADVRSVAIN